MKEIPLSQGYVAVVDDEDYELVSRFKWSALVNRRKDGTIKHVYAVRTDKSNKMVLLHRFLLGLPPGQVPIVDHHDRDGLNNQKGNLRRCGLSHNAGNAQKHTDGITSKFKGVYWNKRAHKWQAQIQKSNHREYLGVFHSEVRAAQAYDAAARRLFGEFALTNF
jgi:hypothetical protein